jgi:RHS repeat-associated protein
MLYRRTADTTFSRFWFARNLQGDIVAIYDDAGTKQVSYLYDAFGNYTQTTHVGGTKAVNNRLLYRGYYYDSSFYLYRTATRWYDPLTGRFISPDVYVSTGQGLIGNNMYAYCNNNPVMERIPPDNIP